ncbi:DUF4167 domain-containing protein [Phyllobacterium sp. LjRoot231]|uniref:DUF4167 domain-containing protein n=1 Tax=Phyllobacterium sp. LjRoot231 TaxID=3342289 RepID=UPI003ECE0818
MNTSQSKPSTAPRVQSQRATTKNINARSNGHQGAHVNYERYLSQARDEARIGNQIEAENYYQHAEHYFRMIHQNPN